MNRLLVIPDQTNPVCPIQTRIQQYLANQSLSPAVVLVHYGCPTASLPDSDPIRWLLPHETPPVASAQSLLIERQTDGLTLVHIGTIEPPIV